MNTTVCDVCDKRIGKNGRYSYYMFGARVVCQRCFNKRLRKNEA